MGSPRSTYSSKPFAVAILASIFVASAAHADFTSVTANKCLAGKIAATGKSLALRALCFSKEARAGAADAACHQKAADKFTGGADPSRGSFAKLENKFAATDTAPCLSFADQAVFDTAIADFASSLVSTIGSAPGKCDAAKIKCTGKYVAAMSKCFASAAKDSGAVEPACTAGAATNLSGCLDKAALQTDCTNAGSQATALAADANDFVRATLCALDETNPGCACVPANDCFCVASPPAPPNGTYADCTSAAPSDTCDLECNAGYTQSGADPTCVDTGAATGDWSGSPTCSPNPCATGPTPPPGGAFPTCVAGNVSHGTTCDLSCDLGYAKSGSTDPVCTLGVYSNAGLTSCDAASCPAVTDAPGTTSDCTEKPTGSTCSFSCTSGYTPSGSGAGRCVGTGPGTSEWQLDGSCDPDSCVAPLPVANGVFSTCAAGDVPSGTDCPLTCANGYTAAGDSPHCFLGSYTSNVPATCDPATCDAMSTPPGVLGACAASPTGTTCPLSCSPGYSGSSVIATCSGTGPGTSDWIGMPSCTQNPCAAAPPAPVGGSYPTCAAGNVAAGTTCHLSCANGYTKTGSNGMTCGLGLYSGSDEQCVPATCPQAIGHGYASNCASSTTGATCPIGCSPGYTEISGAPAISTCIGVGPGLSVWNANLTCEANPCPTPPTPPVGGSFPSCSAPNIPSGTTCTLVCANGYTKTGSDASCSLGAIQNVGNASCVPANCPAYSPPGVVSGCAPSPTGSTCSMSCAPGYTGTPGTASCAGIGVGTSAWFGGPTCTPIP